MTELDFIDGTPFDTRTKLLLKPAIPTLLRLLLRDEMALALSEDAFEWVALPNEEPLVLHRHADFVVCHRPTGVHIQIELQTRADRQLLRRCYVYAAPYFFYLGILPRQYVLHLGSDPANYPTIFDDGWHRFEIKVIDLKQIPAGPLLASDIPEVVAFAVLCAAESPEQLVDAIFARLKALVLDPERLGDYISIVDTLGDLRDLQSILEEKHKDMSLHFDITRTVLYRKGEARGEAKGKAEGEAKGKAEGEAKAQKMLVQAMRDKGGLSPAEIVRVTGLTEAQVRALLA